MRKIPDLWTGEELIRMEEKLAEMEEGEEKDELKVRVLTSLIEENLIYTYSGFQRGVVGMVLSFGPFEDYCALVKSCKGMKSDEFLHLLHKSEGDERLTEIRRRGWAEPGEDPKNGRWVRMNGC